MKLIANKRNLKKYAKILLGNEYTKELEDKLIKTCTEKNVYHYWTEDTHKSFAEYKWLSEINSILKMYGVESLAPDVNLYYCNSGDTYNLTIYHFNDKLYIGDWGSIAEKYIK